MFSDQQITKTLIPVEQSTEKVQHVKMITAVGKDENLIDQATEPRSLKLPQLAAEAGFDHITRLMRISISVVSRRSCEQMLGPADNSDYCLDKFRE